MARVRSDLWFVGGHLLVVPLVFLAEGLLQLAWPEPLPYQLALVPLALVVAAPVVLAWSSGRRGSKLVLAALPILAGALMLQDQIGYRATLADPRILSAFRIETTASTFSALGLGVLLLAAGLVGLFGLGRAPSYSRRRAAGAALALVAAAVGPLAYWVMEKVGGGQDGLFGLYAAVAFCMTFGAAVACLAARFPSVAVSESPA